MIKRKGYFVILWVILILIFFFPIFFRKVPIPLDTIVGLYHPWRDQIWNGLSSGVPYKNFLITDPVRQQIPYRFLAIEGIKKGFTSAWNPYSFSGTPLSANIQSGYYYPLNLLFIFLPFNIAWTLLIITAPLLAGVFLYCYLRFFRLKKISCLFGSLVFAFSGFFTAWMEWGTITHVILWLPLILLAKEKLLQKVNFQWFIILVVAQASQLLAGHLQISFYVVIFSTIYLLLRISQYAKNKNLKIYLKNFLQKSIPFIIIPVLVVLIVSIQYIPLIRYINLSARLYDLPNWQTSSWFLPWKHLVQLIIPDFFGNPSTLNYWGEWNYGEFVSYIGIVPLIFSLLAVTTRRDKKTLSFLTLFLFSFLIILPNPISKIPYQLNISFFSTAQPTRLLCLTNFALSILSALGLDYLLSFAKNKRIKYFSVPLFIIITILALVWLSIYFGRFLFDTTVLTNLRLITKRNLLLPTGLILLSSLLLIIYARFRYKVIIYLLILLSVFDLFRFGRKFISFSDISWFYPNTKIISYLQFQNQPFRFMTTDRRLIPPNFSAMYQLEDVSGYDPLYLLNYAKLVQAWTSNSPNINPGRFNRIITPQNYDSFITDLLNVKYILSLSDIKSEKLVLRLQEGETRLYENLAVIPRFFLVNKAIQTKDESEEIQLMYNLGKNLRNTATVKETIDLENRIIDDNETVNIVYRSNNFIKLRTATNTKRLLVLSEIYYPSWNVYIDGVKSRIITVDLTFRGVIIPQGEHFVEFKYQDI